jgi:hypothetical protein
MGNKKWTIQKDWQHIYFLAKMMARNSKKDCCANDTRVSKK